MSRLTDLGPGEITDRLTILALKILFGQQAGKDCTHWQTERSKLLPQLRSKTLNGTWFEHTLELAAINAVIWHNEDGLRALRTVTTAEGLADAGRRGILSQTLNERRAALIARINELAGEKSVGEEKVYG